MVSYEILGWILYRDCVLKMDSGACGVAGDRLASLRLPGDAEMTLGGAGKGEKAFRRILPPTASASLALVAGFLQTGPRPPEWKAGNTK